MWLVVGILIVPWVHSSATNVKATACAGFSDGGFPEDCCAMEAAGVAFAKLAWDNNLFPKSVVGANDQHISIDVDYVDTAGDPGAAISCAYDAWYVRGHNVVVGGGWSSLSKPMAQLGKNLQGAVLDWGGTDDGLSDTDLYPLYSRVAPPDAAVALGLAELLSKPEPSGYGITRLVMFYETGEWGSNLKVKLTDELLAINPDIDIKVVPLTPDPSPGDEETLRQRFREVKDQLYRIHIILGLRATTYEVLAEPEFDYIVGEDFLQVSVADAQVPMQTLSFAVLEKFKGMQVLKAGSDTVDLVSLSNSWQSLTAGDFGSPVDAWITCPGGAAGPKADCWWEGAAIFANTDMLSDTYFAWGFDAFWLLQNAVQSLINDGNTTEEIKGKLLHDKIIDLTNTDVIKGLTGTIGLRANNGDRITTQYEVQYLATDSTQSETSWVTTATYNALSKTLTPLASAVYADGTANRPPDAFAACAAGHFRAGSGCVPAPRGHFVPQTLVAIAEAYPCPVGQFSAETGADRCKPCLPGTATNQAASESCDLCLVGTEQSAPGSAECTSCEPGTVAAVLGQSKCDPCKKGSYQEKSRQAKCMDCAKLHSTASDRAESRLDCRCKAGYYKDAPHNCKDGICDCIPCKEGMSCAFGCDMKDYLSALDAGFSQDLYPAQENSNAFPLLMNGYWSNISHPLKVFRCLAVESCPGDLPGSCSGGKQGQACARCPEGTTNSGGVCKECNDLEVSKFLFPALPLLLAPILVSVLYFMFRDNYDKWESWQNSVAAVGFLVVNHYQVISMMYTGNLQFPATLTGVYGSWQFTEDPMTWFSTECAGVRSFQDRYLSKLMTPVALLLAFIITFLGSRAMEPLTGQIFDRSLQLRMDSSRSINIFMSLMYTFFTGIASSTLSLFKCSDNPSANSTLTADQTMECYSAEWQGTLGLAIVGILVYCVGFCGVMTTVVFVAPSRFRDEMFQRRWKFLFIKYRPAVYWWSLVFLGKAIFLNLGFMLLLLGVQQMLWIYSISLLYLTLCIFFFPWRVGSANTVEFTINISIITGAAFAGYFAYRVDHTDDLEQQLDTATASVAFLPVVIGAITVAKVLLDKHPLFQHLTSMFKRERPEETTDLIRVAAYSLALMKPDELAAFLKSVGEYDHRQLYSAMQTVAFELIDEQSGSYSISRLSPQGLDGKRLHKKDLLSKSLSNVEAVQGKALNAEDIVPVILPEAAAIAKAPVDAPAIMPATEKESQPEAVVETAEPKIDSEVMSCI